MPAHMEIKQPARTSRALLTSEESDKRLLVVTPGEQ